MRQLVVDLDDLRLGRPRLDNWLFPPATPTGIPADMGCAGPSLDILLWRRLLWLFVPIHKRYMNRHIPLPRPRARLLGGSGPQLGDLLAKVYMIVVKLLEALKGLVEAHARWVLSAVAAHLRWQRELTGLAKA